jgi:hypothetical protein
MIPRSRSGHDDAAIENRLNAIERGLVDQRLEIAAGGHATVRALDPADVIEFRTIWPKLCGESTNPRRVRNPASVIRAMLLAS